MIDVAELNETLRHKSPEDIITWVFSLNKKSIVTTNFRPYESAILYAITRVKKDALIVWCDTGYNTPATYRHAHQLIKDWNLNIAIYVPQLSTGYRDVVLGIPEVNTPEHDIFTEQVKLEPFKRAMQEHQPEIWFTNLRKGQTAFRDSIDVLSFTKDGVLKVSPFYHWSDEQLDDYLNQNNIPNEHNYFDPTKVLDNRECGLHA